MCPATSSLACVTNTASIIWLCTYFLTYFICCSSAGAMSAACARLTRHITPSTMRLIDLRLVARHCHNTLISYSVRHCSTCCCCCCWSGSFSNFPRMLHVKLDDIDARKKFYSYTIKLPTAVTLGGAYNRRSLRLGGHITSRGSSGALV